MAGMMTTRHLSPKTSKGFHHCLPLRAVRDFVFVGAEERRLDIATVYAGGHYRQGFCQW